MWRTCKLWILVIIFLSSCGGHAENNGESQDIQQATDPSMADKLNKGAELFSKYGCFICHSLDGTVMYGPPLNDLYLNEVSVLRKGKLRTLVAKRKYLKKSITDPDYEKVLNYENRIMPEPSIPKEDLESLIDYLIALDEEE